jgi:peptide/nickel transport system ATP-binding protein
MSTSQSNILTVEGLNLQVTNRQGKTLLLNNIHLTIPERSIVGLAGSSGCGKSLTAFAIMQMLRKKREFSISGDVYFGKDMLNLAVADDATMTKLRGGKLSLIMQEAASALNPVRKCGHQLEEIIEIHNRLSHQQIRERAYALLEKVKLTDIERIYNAYPHEISGGQAQRLMIAMGIANNPDLIIADEPTTGLDSALKFEILDLFKELQQGAGCALLLISHEMDIIRMYAEQCYIMSEGCIVEAGSTEKIFHNPGHEFTKRLIHAQQQLDQGIKKADSKDSNRHILEVSGLTVSYTLRSRAFFKPRKQITAIKDITFALSEGCNLGIIGPSGSGKSTLAKCLTGLLEEYSGEVSFPFLNSRDFSTNKRKSLAKYRQLIFQDPYSALHPSMKILEAVKEPIMVHKSAASEHEAQAIACNLLQKVNIRESLFDAYPSQLSGGERQRVCIARALTLQPRILILDEAVSKLDGINTVEILDLLLGLQQDYTTHYIVISHDMRIVRYMCDKVMALQHGEMVFLGDTQTYFEKSAAL